MAATDLPIDEYLCYQAKAATKVPGAQKFLGAEISTKDDLETADFRNYLAAKHVSLCNPITSLASPQSRPDVHLVEYQIKESKLNLNLAKFAPDGLEYTFSDRLGNITPVKISKFKSILVRSAKADYGAITKCKLPADCTDPGETCQNKLCLPTDLSSPASPADLSGTADYTCYTVKAPKIAKGTTATAGGIDIEDQFSYPQEYELKKITKVCVPTAIGAPNPGTPAAPKNAGHLVCYQAKALKGTGPAEKFLARNAAISDPTVTTPGSNSRWLEVKKQTEICIPAVRTPDNDSTPTTMTLTSQEAGGTCGTITMNVGGEGVPNRLNPATGESDNSLCTAAGVPFACCEGLETGHCNEGTSITCGSLSFGGGGPTILFAAPEIAQSANQRRRFSLSCASPTDTNCTISGHPGDLPNGVNCTQTGCGFLPPLETDMPFPLCATIRLGAPASGTLDLTTGVTSLNVNVSVGVHLGAACARCRETTSVMSAPVLATGPDSPGVGVCDTTSGTPGATCYVLEQDPESAGLSANCPQIGAPLATVPIVVATDTTGFSFSDASGHFCPGQGGNADCVGPGNPIACCSGAGAGSCAGNFNGCFASANAGGPKFADTPGICTGVSATGLSSGVLFNGIPGDNILAGQNCVSPTGLALIDGALGIPSKVVATQKSTVEVN